MKPFLIFLFVFIIITVVSGTSKVKIVNEINKVTVPNVSENLIQSYFIDWMSSRGKSYESNEFIKRYTIFKNNFNFIREWNSQGSSTILGLNGFADLSNKEFKDIYNQKPISIQPSTFSGNRKSSNILKSNPQYFDWRAKGSIVSIQNQGKCNAGYAFAATGAMAASHQITSGNLKPLSAQQIIGCSNSYGNKGCQGGTPNQAFQYVINNGGIDTELSYPFNPTSSGCNFDPTTVIATFTSITNVTKNNEEDLEDSVLVTPVAVIVDGSSTSFQLYQSGVFYDASCSPTVLTVPLLVVGYSSIPSSSSSSTTTSPITSTASSIISINDQKITKQFDSNPPYWICMNSWSKDWGLQGYILMAKDANNNCGIASAASYIE